MGEIGASYRRPIAVACKDSRMTRRNPNVFILSFLFQLLSGRCCGFTVDKSAVQERHHNLDQSVLTALEDMLPAGDDHLVGSLNFLNLLLAFVRSALGDFAAFAAATVQRRNLD